MDSAHTPVRNAHGEGSCRNAHVGAGGCHKLCAVTLPAPPSGSDEENQMRFMMGQGSLMTSADRARGREEDSCGSKQGGSGRAGSGGE
mmetsp:Transcript_11019/g.25601  ORF Transcript_11019/g.25601 Transcript_11019/m.25601 type:complete len:88 (-) Transcript_11019:296-559(-)